MSAVSLDMRNTVGIEAKRFLLEHGFKKPPLDPNEALAARDLQITQYSLDDLLVEMHLENGNKIQAMLNTRDKQITFRSGLPTQKRNWGSLHEVGHEFLPWHREILYYCPLLWLPTSIQDEIEAEADTFAAECFFFGDQFDKIAQGGDFGFSTAIDLAEYFGTSKHATFIHYVERSLTPCCLLVWKPNEYRIKESTGTTLQQYVKSDGFKFHFEPGQQTDAEDVITQLMVGSKKGIVQHEMEFELDGKTLSIPVESFSNSYQVFTLVSEIPSARNNP